MITGDRTAIKVFQDDVQRTYKHIIERAKFHVENTEKELEDGLGGREQIQLVAANESEYLFLSTPLLTYTALPFVTFPIVSHATKDHALTPHFSRRRRRHNHLQPPRRPTPNRPPSLFRLPRHFHRNARRSPKSPPTPLGSLLFIPTYLPRGA
jgi:hypothetical protein